MVVRLAWGLWVVCILLSLFGLLLAFMGRTYPTDADSIPFLERYLMFLPSNIAWPTAGALIAARHPRNPIGWLLLASGLLNSAGGVAESYWRYALFAQPGALPGGLAMLWVNTRPYDLAIVLDMLLVLLFPTGRAPARWWWTAGLAIMLGALVRFTAIALMPGPLDPSVTIDNPIGLASATGLLATIAGLGTAMQVGGALAAATVLILRLRRAHGVERQQIKLLVYALTLYIMSGVAITYQIQASGAPASPLTNLIFVGLACSGVLVAGAIATAILRHHLFDIDIIINRTLVYGSLTGALLLTYFGCVALLQWLFRALTGQSSGLAIIASTLVIAALFQPLRRRIQAFIDRRFFRRHYNAALILAGHAATVRDEVDPDRLTSALIDAADETMRPAHASLWLREPDGRE